MSVPEFHALLIGIDGYLPNRRPGGVEYLPLAACVNDVRVAERFLRGQLAVPEERIEKLVAPAVGVEALDPATLPTYESMVAAWKRLIAHTQPGDQAFLFYSGHGGRAKTSRPKIKGPRGLDECLVPYDIGQTAKPRYLRDVEIQFLLLELAGKGVFTTVVLDCCHSGGGARKGARVRGGRFVDESPLCDESLVANPEELAAVPTARERSRGGFQARTDFDQRPYGYTLLAACRPHELAIEASLGGEPRGALSYHLFRRLEQPEPRLTYQRLYEHVLAHIQADYPFQTPLVEGESERLVFGREEGLRPRSVAVMAVEESGEAAWRLQLRSGAAQGVTRGASFAILAPEQPPEEARLATAVVEQCGATTAWAEVVASGSQARAPRTGDEAVWLDPGEMSLKRPVWAFDERGEELLANLREKPRPFLDWSGEGDENAGFYVWVDDRGVMQLALGDGQAWESSPSELCWGEPGALERFARRLDHLARWRNVRELANPDLSPRLRGQLRCFCEALQAGYRHGDALRRRRLGRVTGPPLLKVRESLCLTLENHGHQALNVTVLDLGPDGSISQVLPHPARGAFEVLEPDRPVHLPLTAHLAAHLDRGRDVLKVFATYAPLSFCWLELPALDQPLPEHGALRSRAKSPLDQLLASMAALAPTTRCLVPPPEAKDEWWVETLMVEIKR